VAVAVFGQLDRLLRERSLTVADLKRDIEERFDLLVDEAALECLVSSDELREVDLTLVGAVVDTLGLRMDDLFAVQSVPVNPPASPPKSFLTEQQDRRLAELFDQQDRRKLTADEQRELQTLVYDEFGRRSNDYFRRKEAQKRGVSLEQVQREEDERIARAMKYHRWLNADPRRIQELAERVKARKTAAPS
jgi:hypothetical protein